GIRSTTYPSYALNLAQLGALCISNLCATKPIGSVPVAFAQDEGELCPFIGQASFKTAESEIILLLPPSYQFSSQDCVTGHLSNAFGQHVYKAKGDIEIIGVV
ncbi:hypothetical protein, partial [Acinetobacter lwoffii]